MDIWAVCTLLYLCVTVDKYLLSMMLDALEGIEQQQDASLKKRDLFVLKKG